MTTVEHPAQLATVVSTMRHVLLDFDGPVCSIFAGVGAPTVAGRLRDLLATRTAVPEELADVEDPLQVIRHLATEAPELVEFIDSALRREEVAAAQSAKPTPGAEELIRACRATERTVAIVSNNSEDGIEAYLRLHDLDRLVDLVVARPRRDPALMKPDPFLVVQALDKLGAAPGAAVLVGDSPSDIEAARTSGVRTIGFANKAGKGSRLAAAGADVVVESLAEVTTSIRAAGLGQVTDR